MASGNIENIAKAIDQTPNPSTPVDRTQVVEKLYCANFASLLEAASDHHALMPEQPYEIASGIARYLLDYEGPLTDESFRKWAEAIIVPARQLYVLRNEHSKSVLEGIWRILRTCPDLMDDSTVNVLEAEVWAWVFENLDSILTQGAASIATRLHAKAYWIARTFKTVRVREKQRFCDLKHLERLREEPTLVKGRQIHFPAEPIPEPLAAS